MSKFHKGRKFAKSALRSARRDKATRKAFEGNITDLRAHIAPPIAKHCKRFAYNKGV